jgi:3-oxoacyl-[acyl-carrier protein] reductase
MLLEGKRAVITGAARGIGYAIAERFLREGAAVVLCDLHEDRLKTSIRELSALGDATGQVADVSDRAAVNAFVADALRDGPIDILVNNAGIGISTPFLELTDYLWDRTMAVNLKGAFHFAQAVLTGMIERGRGAIINIGSTNGMRGQPTMAHYNASKAAIISLTQTLAVEFAPMGIRVNCVCPGSIATELNLKESGWSPEFLEQLRKHIPVRRFGLPEDVGWACAFVASDAANFMTGQTLVLDGGLLAQQFGSGVNR